MTMKNENAPRPSGAVEEASSNRITRAVVRAQRRIAFECHPGHPNHELCIALLKARVAVPTARQAA